MADVRLAAGIWVSAYMQRLRGADIPAFVVRRGDDIAGSILVKLNTLNGNAVLRERGFDMMQNKIVWRIIAEGDDAEVEQAIAQQAKFDPDIWVVEVEDKLGRDLLDQPGLA